MGNRQGGNRDRDGVISLAQWQAELERVFAEGCSDEGMTLAELAAALGHGDNWVSVKVLRPAMAAGRLVLGFREGRRIDGQRCKTPVYRLKGESAQKPQQSKGQRG